MKKLTAVLALAVLAYSCGSGEQKAEKADDASAETAEVEMIKSDLAKDNMMGAVKSFEQTLYTPDEEGNISEMDSCCMKMEEYDKNGYMKKMTEKTSAGEISRIGELEHTEKGEFVSYTATRDGMQTFKREVDRSSGGMKAMDTDTSGLVRVHVADAMNEFDQPTSGKTYMPDGTTLVWSWVWNYENGTETGQSWKDSTGVEVWNSVGELNEKGWMAKETQTEVDEEGNSTTTVMTYTYDSMDEMGNWTQKTEYTDGVATKVVKRSYAYYEE